MARIVVLTPNPAVDVTYRVDRQVIGETVRVLSVQRRAGGKGLNVVRVLRVLGHAAAAVQPLGGEAGRWVQDQLLAEGTESVAVPVGGETRSTVAVVDTSAHPTLYAEPGPVVPDEAWTRIGAAVTGLCEPGGVLVVAGSFPPGTTDRHVQALVAAGRRAGARVLVDTSGPALLAAADAGADVVKPNAAEACEATGVPDLDGALAALRSRGAAAVVVSRGAAGLLAVGADGVAVTQPAVPRVEGNPTGAGDAATAGLVAALVAGASLPEALRWAAVLGAAAVLQPTAGDVRLADLDPLADRLPGGPGERIPFPPVPEQRPS